MGACFAGSATYLQGALKKEDTNDFLCNVEAVQKRVEPLLPQESKTRSLFALLMKEKDRLMRDPVNVAVCGPPGEGKTRMLNMWCYPDGDGAKPLHSGGGIGHRTTQLTQLLEGPKLEVCRGEGGREPFACRAGRFYASSLSWPLQTRFNYLGYAHFLLLLLTGPQCLLLAGILFTPGLLSTTSRCSAHEADGNLFQGRKTVGRTCAGASVGSLGIAHAAVLGSSCMLVRPH